MPVINNSLLQIITFKQRIIKNETFAQQSVLFYLNLNGFDLFSLLLMTVNIQYVLLQGVTK